MLLTYSRGEDIVGQVFLTNDTLFNVNKVILTNDVISNICWKRQLSKQDIIKEDFLISLLER